MDGFNCKMCGNTACYDSLCDAEILFNEIWKGRFPEKEKCFFYGRKWEGVERASSQCNCHEYLSVMQTVGCSDWLVNRIEKGILYDE